MKFRKEDKQLWIENRVIDLLASGGYKSEAKHRAEEEWEDMMAEDVEDIAVDDEFECDRCHGIFDNDDSIKVNGRLYCPECIGKDF